MIRAKLNLTRRLPRLLKRDRIDIKRVVAPVEDVGRELHLYPIVSGHHALFKRNRFKQSLVSRHITRIAARTLSAIGICAVQQSDCNALTACGFALMSNVSAAGINRQHEY